MNEVIVDVREEDEFANDHIKDSINLPLSKFLTAAPAVLAHLKDKKIILMCRSGKRASLAKDLISKYNLSHNVDIYNGGILEWKNQGNATEVKRATAMPLMRQVQVVAGSLIVIFSLLSMFVTVNFLFATLFIGSGLLFAGLSGTCLMANILAKMPWNKSPHKPKLSPATHR